jgi:tRNA(fMet)-specific endonuclease VapC
MPPRYMLDTNICIHIRRKRPAAIVERFGKLAPGAAVISVISYGELRYGAEKHHDRDRSLAVLEELVTFLRIEPLPAAAAEVYGEIRHALAHRGELIGSNDTWIAAHALSSGLTLVTRNEREFRRVPGLTVENWAGPDD